MVQITIPTKDPNKPITYYMNDRLNNVIEKKIIPDLQKKDKDCVIVVDGGEGAGKSTFAFQFGKRVDSTLTLDRVTFNAEEFRQAILKAKKGQCVIYDEAFTGLSSRAALSGVNRVLVSLMMQMRQKNLFVIVVLPTFFLLEKYVALFRTRILIHVYENKGVRGYFRIYNKKKKKNLYLMGKQSLSYSGKKWKIPVFTKFKGRFYGVFALGDEKVELEYRKKKGKALEATEHDPMSAGQIKYREQRDICLYILRKKLDLTYEQLSNLLGDYDLEISRPQVANICAKYGDREKKEEKKHKIIEEIEPKEDLDKKKDDFDIDFNENDEEIEEIDDFEEEIE
jgi:hypothetical protein